MFTLTSLSSSGRSSAIRSRTGETAWHGPHHSAQKSTITGLSLWMTSCSKVVSVTALAMRILSLRSRVYQIYATLKRRRQFLPSRGRPSGLHYDQRMFEPMPSKPEHVPLELDMLERWDRERTFERLRRQNQGGPRWSFMDGPITANNPMAV